MGCLFNGFKGNSSDTVIMRSKCASRGCKRCQAEQNSLDSLKQEKSKNENQEIIMHIGDYITSQYGDLENHKDSCKGYATARAIVYLLREEGLML